MKTCCDLSANNLGPPLLDRGLARPSAGSSASSFCLLLLSAANTAIVAMIGLLYMTAQDGEMPPQFKRLNRHGVPLYPLLIAVGLPIIVLLTATNFEGLAGLYAIGVVGAITVNLGSCTFNRTIGFTWYDRVLFGITFRDSVFCRTDPRAHET